VSVRGQNGVSFQFAPASAGTKRFSGAISPASLEMNVELVVGFDEPEIVEASWNRSDAVMLEELRAVPIR
jgi:hypothetical protein